MYLLMYTELILEGRVVLYQWCADSDCGTVVKAWVFYENSVYSVTHK